MARKTLEEQSKEVEIKLMRLELEAVKARDTQAMERARKALEALRS